MGIFKKITKGIGRSVKDAGKSFTQNMKNSGSTISAIATLGTAPIALSAQMAGQTLTAVEPVLSQATGILQSNPLLGNLLSSATGLPPSLFGGGGQAAQAADAGGGGGGLFTQQTPMEQAKAMPMWVWLAAGAAALVGVFLIFRKKA